MNLSWPRPGGSRCISEDRSDDFDTEECWEPQQREGRTTFRQVKHKRNRSAFTTDQLTYLENVFSTGRYVASTQRQTIAERLGLSDKCVKVWFQNRRMKEKIMNRELEDDDEYSNNYKGSTSCPSIASAPSSHEQDLHTLSYPMMSLPIIDPDPIPYQDVSRPNSTPSYRSLPSLEICSPNREIKELPGSVRLNYYQDISPVRDEMPSTMTMHGSQQSIRSNTGTSNSDYTSSAEYSIDMCKRYKDMLDNYKRNETVSSWPNTVQHNQPSPSYNVESVIDLTKTEPLDSLKIEPQDIPEMEPQYTPEIQPQDAPEDLSMKKTNAFVQNNYHSAGLSNYVESCDASALPIYVSYPQPFANDGKVTWNQVIIPPAIPHNNIKPAAKISIVPKASTSKPKNYYVPKNRCNCCKCPKKPKPPEPKTKTGYTKSGAPYVIKVLYPKYN